MTLAGEQPNDGPIRFGTATARWVLVGTILGSGIVSLDATVVNVALPRLGDDLDAGFAGLQWVVNGYTLTLASLILVGGSLGDRFGRRRIFVVGVVWFAARVADVRRRHRTSACSSRRACCRASAARC